MSISEKINNLTSSRNTIRSKMVEAGQATGNELLSQLAGNLTIGDYIEKKASLPTASSELDGMIYMYTGATAGELVTGYFYKCEEDPENAGSYIWAQIDVQPGGGDIDTATPTFTEAATRANIASGETISTLFGKIKKFFTDLKTVAFTGSYTDLDNKPTIDSALSTSSTNAVQNKIVKAEAVSIRKLSGIEIASSQLAVGATSVTFSNAAIKSTSQLTLYSDNSSNTPIFWTGVTVNNGVSAVYTFPALTVATTFYLQIINDFQTTVPA